MLHMHDLYIILLLHSRQREVWYWNQVFPEQSEPQSVGKVFTYNSFQPCTTP